ncbi:MAG: hypothetical protein ABI716_01440 [Candidatus Saccharibacteria bacterium]
MDKRKKLQIIFGLIGALFIGLVIFSLVYLLTPRATLNLALAPESAFMTIDGGTKQAVMNKQQISISPGKHSLEFSRSEFDSLSKNITIDNKQTVDIIAALTPQTEAAYQLMRTPAAEEVIQMSANEKAKKAVDQLNKDYPILSVLPINARLYTINSCPSLKYPNNPTKIALCVDAYHSGLEPYIDKDITSRGFKPSDYEILIIDKFTGNPTNNQ